MPCPFLLVNELFEPRFGRLRRFGEEVGGALQGVKGSLRLGKGGKRAAHAQLLLGLRRGLVSFLPLPLERLAQLLGPFRGQLRGLIGPRGRLRWPGWARWRLFRGGYHGLGDDPGYPHHVVLVVCHGLGIGRDLRVYKLRERLEDLVLEGIDDGLSQPTGSCRHRSFFLFTLVLLVLLALQEAIEARVDGLLRGNALAENGRKLDGESLDRRAELLDRLGVARASPGHVLLRIGHLGVLLRLDGLLKGLCGPSVPGLLFLRWARRGGLAPRRLRSTRGLRGRRRRRRQVVLELFRQGPVFRFRLSKLASLEAELARGLVREGSAQCPVLALLQQNSVEELGRRFERFLLSLVLLFFLNSADLVQCAAESGLGDGKIVGDILAGGLGLPEKFGGGVVSLHRLG